MNLSATLGLNNAPFLAGLGGASAGLGGFRSGLVNMLGPLAALSAGLTGVGAAARVAFSSITEAAKMEDLQGSFATLLGSEALAIQRMEDLARAAAETPFELTGLASTSRLLQAFTGDALATGAGLRLVGDMAAAVNQPLEAVGMWMGRLYAALREGLPLGEPIQNLTQLGLVSGETRRALAAIEGQALGAAATMQVLEKAFGNNAGAMARLAETYNGRVSTMSDAWAELRREVGGPLMEVAKGQVSGATSMLQEFTGMLKDAKVYWADFLGVVRGRSVGGLETITALVKQARELETIEDKTRLVVNIQEELIRLQERAANAPALDFSQSIQQAERLLAFIEKLPEAALYAAQAQRDAAAQLAAISEKSPELNTAINDSSRFMADQRDRQRLRDPSLDPLDRQVSAIMLAQRATEGVLMEPPQNLEQAKERLELEMQLVENMRKHPNLLELAAKKAVGIADAYREILDLQGQVRPIVGQAMEEAVRSLMEEIYGDANQKKNGPTDSVFQGLGNLTADRLSRIGGFIGASGGPALDYARRSAVAAERTVERLTMIERKFGQSSESGISRWV